MRVLSGWSVCPGQGAKLDRDVPQPVQLGNRCWGPGLFAITPVRDLAFFVEIHDPKLGAMAEIKREERLAHVQMINPGLAFARHLDIVRLPKVRGPCIGAHRRFYRIRSLTTRCPP